MQPLAVALLLMLGLFAPLAQGASGLESSLRACAEVADDTDRLACFDALVPVATAVPDAAPRAAEQARQRQRSEQTEQTEQTDDGTVRADPERDFGIETLPPRFDVHGEAVDAIESRIERLQRRPHGEYVFELANGQRWTQIETGRARYRSGQPVTIERTTLGAYMLSTDQGRATRVRRLD